MKQFTERQVIMISQTQAESLAKLKQYDVNVSQFIRQAIKEKIGRDWKEIKEKRTREKLPF
jgi:post-segregation antitoxin (ccd killing protein)